MTIHGLLVKILVYQSPELRPRLLTLAQYPQYCHIKVLHHHKHYSH